jgi:hypothetical protein
MMKSAYHHHIPAEDSPIIVRDPAANGAIPTHAWNTIHPPSPAEAAE